MDAKRIDKKQLAILQGPPTYYAGMAVCSKGMKRAEVVHLAVEIMKRTSAPAFFPKILENMDAIKLPQDRNVPIMRRTRSPGKILVGMKPVCLQQHQTDTTVPKIKICSAWILIYQHS